MPIALKTLQFSFWYGIINNWYKKGYKTVEDINSEQAKPKTVTPTLEIKSSTKTNVPMIVGIIF